MCSYRINGSKCQHDGNDERPKAQKEAQTESYKRRSPRNEPLKTFAVQFAGFLELGRHFVAYKWRRRGGTAEWGLGCGASAAAWCVRDIIHAADLTTCELLLEHFVQIISIYRR